MRIPCPYCGSRDVHEFSYLGDANLRRPDPEAPAPDALPDPASAAAFHDYVYLRDNPAGPHQELWYHGSGCRNWLVVTRSTATHAITGARFAKEPS
jgi:heterotetrameric sarcosine oxidase delta subunit